MRHDIESYDQGGEDQDMTWLNGPVTSVMTWRRWTKAMVKSKCSQDP